MPDEQAPGVLLETTPAPELPSRSGRSTRRLSWRRLKLWGTRFIAILAGIPTLIVAGWLIFSIMVLTFHRRSLDLDAIGVPEILSKAGFTSEVATQRLRDAIFAVQDQALTTMARTAVDTDQDLSAITIPKTGLSIQGVAAALRSISPSWRHEIAGEFTQSGTGLSLQL
jgi:hypothetical protein